jgi:hypothetical protein
MILSALLQTSLVKLASELKSQIFLVFDSVLHSYMVRSRREAFH